MSKEIISAMAAAAGITKVQADKCLRTIANEIKTRLASGKNVHLAGIGRFKVLYKKATIGRNNMHASGVKGIPIHIPARKAVKFVARNTILNAMNGTGE